MPDLHFTLDGDIAISASGDMAMVQSPWMHYSQQAYIRMMTPISDYALYPSLGTDLEELIGMPQTAETGEYGKSIVLSALNREGMFLGLPIQVTAIPVSAQAIRFDIYITSQGRTTMILSIEQNLGIE